MTSRPPIDRILLTSILLLTVAGIFIFLSASTGLIVREGTARFSRIASTQILFGLVPGLILMWLLSKINYRNLKSWSPYILLGSMILSMLVFVPGIGFEHGGAKRWIEFGTYTLQPSELLKIGVIIFMSAWLSKIKDKVFQFKWSILPFFIVMGMTGAILFSQPDIDTFLVIFLACFGILITAGVRFKHFLAISLVISITIVALALTKPYFLSRISTYINPTEDKLGAGYQAEQSLIAVGSGGFAGRGFGQSIQKFTYLPEPIGDSIFAVAAEEFGFVGSTALILMFVFFASRGLYLASNSVDLFGKYLLTGIVVMIITQSFINIGAMITIVPLSGIPLNFVSHGGTALLVTLGEMGLMLSISRHKKA